MIRIHKMANVQRGVHLEAHTCEEAAKHFDAEAKYIVVRCELDEDAIGMELAVGEKNQAAQNMAVMARETRCLQWKAQANFAEGTGWRTIWTPFMLEGGNQGPGQPAPRRH